MTRFPEPPDAELDADQRRMAAAAHHGGPYRAFLRAPLLWERLQPVRRYLADESVLPAPAREAAMLAIARHWRSSGGFAAHRALATAAGLSAEQIEAIGRGEAPALDDPIVVVVFDATIALLMQGALDDALFARATAAIGERGVVEIVGLIGFFSTIALLLNVAEVTGDAPFAAATAAYSPAEKSQTGGPPLSGTH